MIMENSFDYAAPGAWAPRARPRMTTPVVVMPVA